MKVSRFLGISSKSLIKFTLVKDLENLLVKKPRKPGKPVYTAFNHSTFEVELLKSGSKVLAGRNLLFKKWGMFMKNDQLILGQKFSPESGLLEDFLVAFAGSALIAVLAQVSVTSGGVPNNGFTLGVFLVALVFGAKRGALALIFYFLEAAVGLPVLPGLAGGLHKLILPNAGYFVGAFIAAILLGNLAKRGWTRKPLLVLSAALIATALIYLIALPWLSIAAPEIPFPPSEQVVGTDPGPIINTLKAGFLPFITGDLLKIAICVLVISLAWNLESRAGVDKKLELR